MTIRERTRAGLSMLALSLAAFGCASSPPGEREIHGHWPHTVASGGWGIQWGSDQAIAWQPGKPYEQPIFAIEHRAAKKGAGGGSDSEHRILSAVGSVVSYSECWKSVGPNPRPGGCSVETVDLQRGDDAEISQIADETSVVRALKANPAIRRYLARADPATLDDLIDTLGSARDVDFSDLPSRFWLRSVAGDRMEIEFVLGPAEGYPGEKLTRIDIEVPVRADLAGMIREAAANLPEFEGERPPFLKASGH